MQYAVIENGSVINVIVWDGIIFYTPPIGILIESSVAGIGDKYEDGKFYYWGVSNPEDLEENWTYNWIERI